MALPPLLVRMTVASFSRSMPAAAPSIRPSAAAAMLQKAIMLLTSLAIEPAPTAPMWIGLAANERSRARCVS
jgi:hypothetical protein